MATDSVRDLSLLPDGVTIEREKNGWSVKYCPDNTCDLLRLSASLKESEARGIALGFFTFYSKYSYLRQWQEVARRDEARLRELEVLANSNCPHRDTKQLVKCRMRELAAGGKLTVYFVRFDEGTRTEKSLRLSEILQ
jgi:hypothetical protein